MPTALITGGTRGIGFGIAQTLARENWSLVLTGVRPASDVAPALRSLQDLGAKPHYIASDIARRADRDALVHTVTAQYGALNALVNNAGRAPRVRTDLLEADEDSFDALIKTNLQGPYFLTQAIARAMAARRRED